MQPLIEIQGVGKHFAGARALEDVSFSIAQGEVHALCGENGAGKSTLNRILAGLIPADSGRVSVDGSQVEFGAAADAEAAGIAIVHQESVAVPDLTAAENLFLMRERGGWWLQTGSMAESARSQLDALGEHFAVDIPMADLTLAQRQFVGIARAVSRNCRLLILDEPTASLSDRETEVLFALVRDLRSKGISVLYVSHRLDEIFALADTVTVLRDGRHVATKPISETGRDDLVRLMVGREVAEAEPTARAVFPEGAQPALRIERLTRTGAFADISLEVRSGEIVALAGLVGAGRSEVARAVFGLDAYDSGEILLGSTSPVPSRRIGPSGQIRKGVALLPEDRQHEGLHLAMSVRENLTMAALPGLGRAGWIARRHEARTAQFLQESLDIRAKSTEARVDSLSGGNQQKVLLGKWLATEPKVLILDEPTRGVDVGAKAEIHRRIRELASDGTAVLVISSELPEVLALADRIVVMRQGRIAGELGRKEATQERILELALPRDAESASHGRKAHRGLPREFGVAALFLIMLLVATLTNPSFLSLDNLRDVLVKVAPAAIVASGLTLVVLAREIDISVGSLMGVCAAALGLACSADRAGWPAGAGIAICLGVGALGGLANGLLVAVGRVPSIIVTLGTLTIFSGITEKLLGGKWIQNMPQELRALGTGSIMGIPYSVLAALAVVAATVWLSKRTAFGPRVRALGSDPRAAEVLGVPGRRLRLILFALTGLLCGVAALFSATQLQVIESGFGKGFELAVVAAVVVGGTSIRGGRGSVSGSVLGALTLGTVGTFLIFLKLGESAEYWERAIQGGLILIAVLADHLGRGRKP